MEIWRYTRYIMDYSQFVRKISILVKKHVWYPRMTTKSKVYLYHPVTQNLLCRAHLVLGWNLRELASCKLGGVSAQTCAAWLSKQPSAVLTDIDEIIPQSQGTGVKFWRNRFSTSVVDPIISHPQFHPTWWVKTIQKWRIKFGSTPCLSSND